jgi:hypothetical protein
MNTSDRATRTGQEMNEIYRAIGRFVVAFEHTNGKVQECILLILDRAGLSGAQGQRMSRIMLADMTADPLRALLQSLVGEAVILDTRDSKLFDDAMKRFQNLIEARNTIVHSRWFVGQDENASRVRGVKIDKNKAGVRINWLTSGPLAFDRLSDDADALTETLGRLNAKFQTSPLKKSNNPKA